MAQTVRYRTGIDGRTGKVLTGVAHLIQSLETIWMTRTDQLVMLLDFASNLRGHLAEDLTPALALAIYNDLVTAVHKFEPEYRIDELQLVLMTEGGGLGLRHGGLYYPEGRFGNYAIAVPFRAAPQRFALGSVAR